MALTTLSFAGCAAALDHSEAPSTPRAPAVRVLTVEPVVVRVPERQVAQAEFTLPDVVVRARAPR